MTTIILDRDVNLDLLVDELFDRFPEWIRINPTGFNETDVVVTNFAITFPDTTPVQQVRQVLERHDRTQDGKREKARKEKKKHRDEAHKKLRQLGFKNEEIDALFST